MINLVGVTTIYPVSQAYVPWQYVHSYYKDAVTASNAATAAGAAGAAPTTPTTTTTTTNTTNSTTGTGLVLNFRIMAVTNIFYKL